MPELPPEKHKPVIRPVAAAPTRHVYVPLQVASNFSFLRGASHPEELIARAAEVGCPAVAITDRHSFAGIVRAHVAAKAANIPLVVGVHVIIQPDTPEDVPREALRRPDAPDTPVSLLLYPTTRQAYGRLCRLLTRGKLRTTKGNCLPLWHDLMEFEQDLLAIYVPSFPLDAACGQTLAFLRGVFTDDRLSLACMLRHGIDDLAHLQSLQQLSMHARVPLVAVNDVVYHAPERRMLQDVLVCVREGCSLREAGFHLHPHAERHIKTPEEMARLFADFPEALDRTLAIAARAAFSLNELSYQYPSEVCPPGLAPMQHLIDLTWKGAAERYPGGVPPGIQQRLAHEFDLIAELDYPAYFLTVHDIVQFATRRNILCQGRGAAANSAVCYCLRVTAVDPARIDLLMERFISKERDEPPDIDIDFEHERREEVIQYIYQRFGRHRAGLTAEVITYRRRSAVRDVGKAMGLSLDCVDRLAKSADWWEQDILPEKQIRELGLDPRQPALADTLRLAGELLGFPRHLSQHVGGFVITRDALCEMVPIENAAMADRTVIEWDKDDIDAMGLLKIDILALGMLTCIRKGIDLVNDWNAGRSAGGLSDTNAEPDGEPVAAPLRANQTFAPHRPLALHTIPPEDPAVYDMLCQADSLGVFQVESRAQMAMLPRMKPRCYYDLVIEVAIVRPGPIQGKMVHPYLRRRNGEEPVGYPDDSIKSILGRTLGVPLFQEQVMRLAMAAAGFTGGEADALRRSMAAWKRKNGQLLAFGRKIIDGMVAHGYTPVFAHRCFEQIKGFGEYGFPESHAASFALLVYVSAWLKCFHPAAFAAALINSQPMGFYQPAQIVRDAQDHGVTVLPVDVRHSNWNCALEDIGKPTPALRLGMRLARRLQQREAEKIAAAALGIIPGRGHNHGSLMALWRASGVRAATMRYLAEADAFNSMGLNRQHALWQVQALHDQSAPLFDALDAPEEPAADLPAIAPARLVIHDYSATGLSLKAHPVSFVRRQLTRRRVKTIAQFKDEHLYSHGRRTAIAGLVLVRQRPATAKGIVFMTLEDETGTANLIVRPNVYEKYRKALRGAVGLQVWGKVQRQEQVVHLLVERAENLYETLRDELSPVAVSRDFH